MKNVRLLFVVAALVITGCATSLAPSDNFNDWASPVVYNHYQQPRSAVATVTPHIDSDEARKE